jgi:ADP-L-glycero-D-manno-heptose 6-epimerase
MTALFLENDVKGLFNIGSGHPTTWNHLAGIIFDVMNKSRHINYIDMPGSLKAAYQNYTLADMQKFKACTHYVPKFTLETAVQDYIINHLLPCRGF